MGAYDELFLKSREAPQFDDGRDIALSDIAKILRAGPAQPDSLAKRAAPDAEEAERAIRKMAQTTAERRANSFADDALSAVAKDQRLVLPHERIQKGRQLRPKVTSVSMAEVRRMLAQFQNLRKIGDATRGGLVGGLPGQSSNAAYQSIDPSRWGSTSSNAGYQALGQQRVTAGSPPEASSMRAGSPPPQDDDIADKRKQRAARDKVRTEYGTTGSEGCTPDPEGYQKTAKNIAAVHQAGPSNLLR
jgi:hypothetical protein